MIASHDLGQTWQVRTEPCGDPSFARLAVATGQLWVMCGTQPGTGQTEQIKDLYRSTDDGQHWQRVAYYQSDTSGSGPNATQGALPSSAVWDLTASTADHLWLIVADGQLCRSVDGGSTWREVDLPYEQVTPGGFGLGPVVFLDANTGWVAGRAGLFRTTDGGERWETVVIP